jgi:hypothetical protein
VIPRLFAYPPARSPAQAVERLSILLLVGSGLFEFVTGVLNIQVFYPFHFGFVLAHYYGAWIFISALALHILVKLPTVRSAYRTHGVLKPLRADLAHTQPQPYEPDGLAPSRPAAATISRRGLLGMVGGASLALLLANLGESAGGPLRRIALLAPRGRVFGTGPNDFQVNKTAEFVKVTKLASNPSWRLTVRGPRTTRSTRTRCRSPVSKGGRRPSTGPGSAYAISPGSSAPPGARSSRSTPCSPLGPTPTPPTAQIRSRTTRRCSRCASTASTCRSIMATRRGSSSRRCQACTAPSGFDALPGGVMRGFKSLYGSNPLHLLAHIGVFFIAGWSIDQIAGSHKLINWIVWFLGAALLHDLVLLPLYSLVDRGLAGGGNPVARAARRRRWLNYIRVPAVVAGILLLVYFPVILGYSRPRTGRLHPQLAAHHRRAVPRIGPRLRAPGHDPTLSPGTRAKSLGQSGEPFLLASGLRRHETAERGRAKRGMAEAARGPRSRASRPGSTRPGDGGPSSS